MNASLTLKSFRHFFIAMAYNCSIFSLHAVEIVECTPQNCQNLARIEPNFDTVSQLSSSKKLDMQYLIKMQCFEKIFRKRQARFLTIRTNAGSHLCSNRTKNLDVCCSWYHRELSEKNHSKNFLGYDECATHVIFSKNISPKYSAINYLTIIRTSPLINTRNFCIKGDWGYSIPSSFLFKKESSACFKFHSGFRCSHALWTHCVRLTFDIQNQIALIRTQPNYCWSASALILQCFPYSPINFEIRVFEKIWSMRDFQQFYYFNPIQGIDAIECVNAFQKIKTIINQPIECKMLFKQLLSDMSLFINIRLDKKSLRLFNVHKFFKTPSKMQLLTTDTDVMASFLSTKARLSEKFFPLFSNRTSNYQ